ncbi:hypothetical protein E3N88_06479 [Mikania micrantha]|uniref:Uncharacterized protein n=1 Tax=Mikania micrantha TaxID=192012 RepID=A0A5N6PNU7_9ASTR|nr:hypothetical protein E3N88_06479 [Mikania micrantha]
MGGSLASCEVIYFLMEVVGFGECADCKDNNIKSSQALSGLKVTIDCKLEDGKFQTRGVGKLNEEGEFKVNLPQEILKDGKLSEECYVQLHNAANAPCAIHNGLESSKIAFVSKSNQKHTFAPVGKLKFSIRPRNEGLWLTHTAHHHLAIAILFLIARHMYRTNWDIGHGLKDILEAHKGPFTGHFSRTIAKGPETTTWIWNLHADAHDFDSHTSDLEEISKVVIDRVQGDCCLGIKILTAINEKFEQTFIKETIK